MLHFFLGRCFCHTSSQAMGCSIFFKFLQNLNLGKGVFIGEGLCLELGYFGGELLDYLNPPKVVGSSNFFFGERKTFGVVILKFLFFIFFVCKIFYWRGGFLSGGIFVLDPPPPELWSAKIFYLKHFFFVRGGIFWLGIFWWQVVFRNVKKCLWPYYEYGCLTI